MTKKNDKGKESQGYEIDYKNLDVTDIMAQIKEKTKEKGSENMNPVGPGQNQDDNHEISSDAGGGSKSKMKKILDKIMKPFSPLIKILVYPVHQEVREALHQLDMTNRRLDHLYQEQMKVLKSVEENLYQLNDRLEGLSMDSDRAQEYIKLLHNLGHNLVVEMTKLKIEEENLKIKTRSLEKSLEMVEWKEKALEKKILQ